MTHLDDELIADLALGVPASAEDRAHLEVCPGCARALESYASTITLTRDGAAEVLLDPPPRVWEAIRAEIHAEQHADQQADQQAEVQSEDGKASEVTPEGDGEGADGPDPAPVTSLDERRSRRALPTTWLVAAAAAIGLLAGIGGTTLAQRTADEVDTAPVAVASARLAPLDSGETRGVASLVDRDGGLELDVPAMDLDPGTGYLEVWLINRDLTRMVSVGVIPDDATETFLPVSQNLIDEGYVIVDVSREPFDDQPAHSGTTLVRGQLDT